MRPTIDAIALALTPTTGFVQPASDIQTFQHLTATIASDPSVAGQWIVLLPVIARQCGMALDHERAALLIDRFDHPESVDGGGRLFRIRLREQPGSRLGRDRKA